MLLPDDEQVYAFVREHEGDRLLVVANLSDAPDVVADLAETTYDGADLLLGSVPGSTPSPTDPLAPWESRVFRLK